MIALPFNIKVKSPKGAYDTKHDYLHSFFLVSKFKPNFTDESFTNNVNYKSSNPSIS